MADWLRPVFGRTRSSLQVSSLATSSDKPLEVNDDGNEDDSHLSVKPRPVSRVSSYIGMPTVETPTLAPEEFPRLRNPENVYYKPDCDHMAETLKVIMMTQDTLDPVPVIYNSHILHLLEAFQDGQEQLARKQHIIEEVKEAHVRDLDEFGLLADIWEAKEKDYKAEIKRLELLLAHTKGGMESVVLARSKSKIHGSKSFSETLGRGFGTIKERYATREQRDKEEEEKRRDIKFRAHAPYQEPTPKVHFHTDLSALRNITPIISISEGSGSSSGRFVGSSHRPQPSRSGTQTPEIQDQEKNLQAPAPPKSFYGHILRPQRSRLSLQVPQSTPQPAASSPDMGWPTQQLTFDKLEELQRQELLKQEVSSNSSTSSSDDLRSVSDMFNKDNPLGIGEYPEKELLDCSDELDMPHFSALSVPDDRLQTRRKSKMMSFSFQPGDDTDIMSPVIGGDFKNRERLEKHIDHLEGGRSNKYPPRHQRPKSISSPDPPSRKLNNYFQRSPEEQKSLTSNITSNSNIMNFFQHSPAEQKSPDEQQSPDEQKSLDNQDFPSVDGTSSFNMTADRQKSRDNPKRLTRDSSSSSVVTAVRHNSGRSSMSTSGSARKIRPPMRRPSGSGSSSARGSSEAVAAAAWAFSGGQKGMPDRMKSELGSRGEYTQREVIPRRELVRKSDGDGKQQRHVARSRIATPVKEGEVLVTKPDKKATMD